jgi:S1-C subfamily serine protease
VRAPPPGAEHGRARAVQAGVGIFFQQEADGSVYVKTIVSGGSAEREGTVRVGDMILAVDNREASSCGLRSRAFRWLLLLAFSLLYRLSAA